MSCEPAFWTIAVRGTFVAEEDTGVSTLTWDEVTKKLISWSRMAMAWQPPADTSKESEKACRREKMPVLLHIYDVSHEHGVRKLNKWLAHKRNPLKFGGVFHAGIEVNGLEWSFGMSLLDSVPGVTCSMPREHPDHRYRQTVKLRCTRLSAEEVADVISQMIEEYPGDDYNLLRRNCCHFADDFARRLGAGRLPGWVHRLARVGALVDSTMQRVANRSLLGDDDSDSDW